MSEVRTNNTASSSFYEPNTGDIADMVRKNVNPLKTGTGTVSASAERRKRKEEAQGKEARSNEVIDNYLLIGSPTIFR